jgi:hypothetical protein
MEAKQKIPALTLYCCNICKTKPDQLSHHKAHLTTQKHIYKKKCFEQCINTSFFNIYNFHQYKDDTSLCKKNKIEEFEKDTGLKFIHGNKMCHDAIRDWHYSKDTLLDEEFPNTIIPLETSFETKEKYENSVKHIIEVNETVTIINEENEVNNEVNEENDKKNKSIKPHFINKKIIKLINEIKPNIENYDIDFFINMAVEEQEPYVIALIMYKLNYNNVYLKKVDHKIIHKKMNKIMSYNDKCWIYKDTINNDNSMNIRNNLRATISKNISPILEEKIKEYTETSNEYMALTKMIHKLNFTMFKNDVMRVAEYLFTTDTL